MRQKVEGGCAPFQVGGAGSLSNTVAWVEAYLRTKCYLDPSSRFVTTTWAKNWGLCPFLRRELGPHLAQYGLGRDLPP